MSLQVFKVLKEASKLPGVFLGGVAFGSLGLKLLASKDAKKAYAKVLAKSYKAKDGLDSVVSTVKQHTEDVLADASDIYEAEKKADNLSSLEGE